MTEPERLGLDRSGRRNPPGKDGLNLFQQGALSIRFQLAFQFRIVLEMGEDGFFPRADDEYEMRDPGSHGFLDRVLDQWAIHDGQQFLGHRLAGRQKTRAQSGDGEDRRPYAFRHHSGFRG